MHAAVEEALFPAAKGFVAAAVVGEAVAGGADFAGGTVVGLEVDNGVVVEALGFELVEEIADDVVDGGDHGEVGAAVAGHCRGKAIEIFLGRHHGVVGGAKGQVEEEGLVGGLLGEVLLGLEAQEFGDVSGFFEDFPVVAPKVVEDFAGRAAELVIAMGVGVEPAGIPAEEMVEALGEGAAFRGAAEVPFAEGGGGIAEGFEGGGEGGFGFAEAGDVPGGLGGEGSFDAGSVGVFAGEDGGAGGGANGGVGVPLGEADAGLGEAVEVGRFDFGVAVAGDVADTVVVGDDEQDVGFAAGLRGG